jgi:hypothetical protein
MAKKEVISDFHEPKLVPASPEAAKPAADSEPKDGDSTQETPKPASSGNGDDE